MSVATDKPKSGNFMRALSTGKGINPRTATDSQAAARAAQPTAATQTAEPPATVQPTATTTQTVPANAPQTQVQTPPVTAAPLTTPEVMPVATTPTQSIPLTQPVAPASQPTGLQPQATESQRHVIKVDNDETLIQFPGEQPKTRAQINFERKQGQDIDRKMTELQNRERQLEERERALRQNPQSNAIGGYQPNVQPAPVVQPILAQPAAPAPMPTLPAGVIEGDPEYTRYQAELMQWSLKNVMPEVMKPILEFTEAQKQAQLAQQTQLAQRQANYDQNVPIITSIPQYLPFDVNGLPEDVQNAVYREIVAVGLKEGVNLADKELPYQAPINPYLIKYITTTAFPPGSLPPGYSYQEPIPTPALDALPPPGTPLVSKAPLSPPLQAGAAGISAPQPTTTAPGRKPNFYQKLGQTRD